MFLIGHLLSSPAQGRCSENHPYLRDRDLVSYTPIKVSANVALCFHHWLDIALSQAIPSLSRGGSYRLMSSFSPSSRFSSRETRDGNATVIRWAIRHGASSTSISWHLLPYTGSLPAILLVPSPYPTSTGTPQEPERCGRRIPQPVLRRVQSHFCQGTNAVKFRVHSPRFLCSNDCKRKRSFSSLQSTDHLC